ncbi:MAG: hypothetical protein LBP96_01545 [Bacteroidales bacterium]|nr:hypothetical protein [Bacteroidales bacterium]
MKKKFPICIFAAMLLLSSCKPSPETLAEKYMALVCADDKIDKALLEAQTDKERARLEAKSAQIHEQMEKVNIQILAKYQDDEEAMKIILRVTENYRCKED